MKWYGICLLAVTTLTGGACIRGTGASVQNQSTNVTFVGSFSGTGGTTQIFFGQQPLPLAQTTSAGSFRVEIPRSLIDTTVDRRLYFYASTGEAAATEAIADFEMGEKSLPPIALKPQFLLSGTVVGLVSGIESPVADAEILVGRTLAKTDSQGKFSLLAPGLSELPVYIHKAGYVQTHGLWKTSSSADARAFHLYNRIEPAGNLSIPVTPRLAGAAVDLAFEGTPSAAYVRIAAIPFTIAPEADGNWLDLSKTLTLPAATLGQDNLYYQFADHDKKVFSSVMTYAVTAAVLVE